MNERNAARGSDDWMEFEGRSKDDAIERACTALNTTRAYLEYKFIGGNKLKARKSETRRPGVTDENSAAMEDPEGDLQPEGLTSDGNFDKPSQGPGHARHPKQSHTPRSGRPEGYAPRPARAAANPRRQGEYEIYDEYGSNDHREPEDRGSRGEPRQDRGGRGGRGGHGGSRFGRPRRDDRPVREPAREEAPANPEKAATKAVEPKEPDTRDYDQLAKDGTALLQDILKFIDVPAEVVAENNEEELLFDLQSDGSGLLIGKRGQMLEALQHLVAKILKLDRNSSKRLIVDSEGYRMRRSDSLAELAEKMADKARRFRKPVSLEPMNAMDRRAIHLALANDRSISTKSVGEGYDRRIVITPKRGPDDRDDRGGRNDRGGRGRGRGERGGRGRGGRGQGAGQRQQPRANRLHDSYDVPAEPKMDMFPDDIDELINKDFGEE